MPTPTLGDDANDAPPRQISFIARTAVAYDRVMCALPDTMCNPFERRARARNRGTALAARILPMQYLLEARALHNTAARHPPPDV